MVKNKDNLYNANLRKSTQAVAEKASVGLPEDIQAEEFRTSGQTSLGPEASSEMETEIYRSVVWVSTWSSHSGGIWTKTKGECTE